MADPGFLSAAIGVLLQTLISKMLQWISIAKSCNQELDKLKDRLLSILSFFQDMMIYVDMIGRLPVAVRSWITKLENLLEEGSKFVEECTVPHICDIIRRGRMAKKITRFTSDLTEHLESTSLLAFLQNLHLHVKFLELIEAFAELRIPASAGSPAPSPAPHSRLSELPSDIDSDSVQLCFLRLADKAFSKKDIRAIEAIVYWIREGLVAGPDPRRTGQIYINLLADCDLIKFLNKDANGNVHRFRMLDNFQHLVNQIVEEEERLSRNTDSQEFSYDERFYARLEVRIIRGSDLAIRDRLRGSSDPYVVAILGGQKWKTRSIRKNLNPRWAEKFDMPVPSQSQPNVLLLEVYDKDLRKDDFMGYGTVDLTNLAKAANKLRTGALSSVAIHILKKDGIECADGHMVQRVCLKLEKVESGKLYLDIKWVDSPRPTSLYR